MLTLKVEKMICSIPTLSSLDEQLDAQFKQNIKEVRESKSLLHEQKLWLVNTRNMCVDSDCLRMAYIARINRLKIIAGLRERTKCAITCKKLLGNWIGNGDGDFEEMAFTFDDNEQSFASWRHHRPDMMGVWSFANCKLSILDPNNPKISFELRNDINKINGNISLNEHPEVKIDGTVLTHHVQLETLYQKGCWNVKATTKPEKNYSGVVSTLNAKITALKNLNFDGLGQPLNALGALLTAQTIQVRNATNTITVEAVTGYVHD